MFPVLLQQQENVNITRLITLESVDGNDKSQDGLTSTWRPTDSDF